MNANRTQRFGAPAGPREIDPFDGVLVVDKPAGPTSHDVVAAIRRRFGIQKVGHGGTLDPQATGVLVILLGKGTKLSGELMSHDKTYEGVMKLGVSTDSQDAQGKITREADASAVTREQLQAAMQKLTGDIYQTPPMVSAVKIAGIPLYKLARKGETVEREAKLIHIYEFTLRSFELPLAAFVCRCTKGTYVRTLCSDAGDALGCGARLEALRRTQSGKLTIDAAMSLDEILKMDRSSLKTKVMPLSQFTARAPS